MYMRVCARAHENMIVKTLPILPILPSYSKVP